MDRDLDVEVFGYGQTRVDGGRRRSPVFVEFEAHGPGPDLFLQTRRQAGIPLSHESEVHGELVCGL